MSTALYNRIKSVCCNQWGCTPVAFDAMADGDQLAAEDVIEAVALRAYTPIIGETTQRYIYREAAIYRAKAVEMVKGLLASYNATSDPAKRSEIEARIKAIQSRRR